MVAEKWPCFSLQIIGDPMEKYLGGRAGWQKQNTAKGRRATSITLFPENQHPRACAVTPTKTEHYGKSSFNFNCVRYPLVCGYSNSPMPTAAPPRSTAASPCLLTRKGLAAKRFFMPGRGGDKATKTPVTSLGTKVTLLPSHSQEEPT